MSAPTTIVGGSSPTVALGSTLNIVADTAAPDTTITSGPAGTVTSQSASFQFTSPDSRNKFECRLDAGDWNRCRSPRSYSQLAYATHTFFARAYDRAGNVDPTPATRVWTVNSPAPPAPAPAPTPSGALLFDGFESANGRNNLVTNEWADWGHDDDPTAVHSPIWSCDGGSLFSVGGQAWTGKLDNNNADKYSEVNTHSDKMRFWTKQGGFGDVEVGTTIKPVAWGSGAPTSWGGFKFYLRREKDETVSAFYTAEPIIADGTVRIQKKERDGETYHVLAEKKLLPVSLGTSHTLKAVVKGTSKVIIELFRDGQLLLTAIDDGSVGGAPLPPGHMGFRSDFLEYYLDDFKVSQIE